MAADQLHVIPILRREDVYEKKKKNNSTATWELQQN